MNGLALVFLISFFIDCELSGVSSQCSLQIIVNRLIFRNLAAVRIITIITKFSRSGRLFFDSDLSVEITPVEMADQKQLVIDTLLQTVAKLQEESPQRTLSREPEPSRIEHHEHGGIDEANMPGPSSRSQFNDGSTLHRYTRRSVDTSKVLGCTVSASDDGSSEMGLSTGGTSRSVGRGTTIGQYYQRQSASGRSVASSPALGFLPQYHRSSTVSSLLTTIAIHACMSLYICSNH